jgi:hypothetical protein
VLIQPSHESSWTEGWRRKNREKERGGKDTEKRGERNQVNEEIEDEGKD